MGTTVVSLERIFEFASIDWFPNDSPFKASFYLFFIIPFTLTQ
jgi:hypothetical protein